MKDLHADLWGAVRIGFTLYSLVGSYNYMDKLHS
jgi:hypothetical protein